MASRPRSLVRGARPTAQISLSKGPTWRPSAIVSCKLPSASRADRLGHGVMNDLHAQIAGNLHVGGAQHGIEMPHHGFAADHQRHLAAQGLHDPGDLDGDVAAADDGDARRALVQLEETIGSGAQFGARQLRYHRIAAGGDDDVRGRRMPVGDLDAVGA